MYWFTPTAFKPTADPDWSKTPVTATSTVFEPATGGVAQPEIWLPLWATGHPAAQCFWLAKSLIRPIYPYPAIVYNPDYIQVTGDPLVRK